MSAVDFTYLVTVAPSKQGEQPYRFITDDLTDVVTRYKSFLVEKIDYVKSL